jgi:hypothetical protein
MTAHRLSHKTRIHRIDFSAVAEVHHADQHAPGEAPEIFGRAYQRDTLGGEEAFEIGCRNRIGLKRFCG